MGDGQLLIRLTPTVSNQRNFCTLIWADNVKDNKNRLCSRIGSGADHPKNRILDQLLESLRVICLLCQIFNAVLERLETLKQSNRSKLALRKCEWELGQNAEYNLNAIS